jgi:hypothetical protein
MPMTKRPIDYYLLWGVALLSLVINLGFGYALLVARSKAAQGAQTAAQAVAALRASTIDYPVHIEQSLPVSLTIPIHETLSVPISATLPIDTQFSFTLHTLIGDFPVNVPLQAMVPVHVQTQVPVNLSVPVSTTVPVAFDVPVHIDLASTSLGQAMAPWQAYLEELAAELQANPFLAIMPR